MCSLIHCHTFTKFWHKYAPGSLRLCTLTPLRTVTPKKGIQNVFNHDYEHWFKIKTMTLICSEIFHLRCFNLCNTSIIHRNEQHSKLLAVTFEVIWNYNSHFDRTVDKDGNCVLRLPKSMKEIIRCQWGIFHGSITSEVRVGLKMEPVFFLFFVVTSLGRH